MYETEFCAFSFWWLIPLLMMLFCFIAMRRRWGPMMCGFGVRGRHHHEDQGGDSAMDLLDKRYASGEIDTAEYEEKKRTLKGSNA